MTITTYRCNAYECFSYDHFGVTALFGIYQMDEKLSISNIKTCRSAYLSLSLSLYSLLINVFAINFLVKTLIGFQLESMEQHVFQ